MDSKLQMSAEPRLYLDHAATTPMVQPARTAMAQGMEYWANPSSPHKEGRAAKAALEDARTRIGKALSWDGDIIFTSGASEALSLALSRANADAMWISAVEHDAVHRACPTAHMLQVDGQGLVASETVMQALKLEEALVPLVAIQSANNETGVIQDLTTLGLMIRERGAIFLADCSQSAGKIPLPDADLIAVSAHKLGGPPGIGALLVRDLGQLSPSGGQEKGYRGGTENLPAVLGFAAALEVGYGWFARAAKLRAELDAAIIASGGFVVSGDTPRIATIASYHMPGVSSSGQLIGFDMAGIAVSAGAACSSGTLKSSPVLAAMGWEAQAASEVIRVSFGPGTSKADIARFIQAWQAIAKRSRNP